MLNRMVAMLLLSSIVFATPGIASAAATTGAGTVRIGVYDSRAVALAYSRLPESAARLQKLQQAHAAAKAGGDAKRMHALEAEGQAEQVRLHLMVFSTAGVGHLLAPVRDQLPGLAREAGVEALVSKWDLPFVGAGVDTVDVTLAMVTLFHPDARTLEAVAQLRKTLPVPLDQLSLDPNE